MLSNTFWLLFTLALFSLMFHLTKKKLVIIIKWQYLGMMENQLDKIERRAEACLKVYVTVCIQTCVMYIYKPSIT